MHVPAATPAIQSNRLELKFEIDPVKATAIREHLRSRLSPDPHNADGAYTVCSVYLDSEDAVLCRQTNDGVRNRHKLRVRVYCDEPQQPAFLEVKSREGRAVKKLRARVDRETATAVLAGEVVSYAQSEPTGGPQRDWLAFNEFCRLRDRIGALGHTFVCYQREAFVSPLHNRWRATFDRQLCAHRYHVGDPLMIPRQCVKACSDELVVFELKYCDRFPNWMRELVQRFNLVAGPYPKYVTCRNRLARPIEGDAPRNVPEFDSTRSSNSRESRLVGSAPPKEWRQ